MNYLFRTYVSQNPAGIIINDGYYALAYCICKKVSVDRALYKICGIPYGGPNRKRRSKKIPSAYVDGERLKSALLCKALSYQRISDLVSCSTMKIVYCIRGHRQPLEFIAELEKVLGLQKNELVKGEIQ